MKLYAKPIAQNAEGFEFSKLNEFIYASTTCRDTAGEQVKKFGIEFIEGSEADCFLAKHWPLKHTTLKTYLEAAENWSAEDKVKYIIAVGELGFERAEYIAGQDRLGVELHKFATMTCFAQHEIDHGSYSHYPKDKIDLQTVTEELAADYDEINIDGVNYIYLAE